jgi:hypothetical protein
MEIFLNLAWAFLATAGICLWQRFEKRVGSQRRLSLIALVMLVVILFPVISVSDDLWSIQNPAETDTCQRRDHLTVCVHATFPGFAAVPEPLFAEPVPDFSNRDLLKQDPVPPFANSLLSEIENRPPPVG